MSALRLIHRELKGLGIHADDQAGEVLESQGNVTGRHLTSQQSSSVVDCFPGGNFGPIDPTLVSASWGSCISPIQAIPIAFDLTNLRVTS